MDRYRRSIFGLCDMRWKNFGETTPEEGHKVFFSRKEDKQEHGVGFLVHKDIVNTVMGSIWLISIRLRAVPFNITIVHVYAPTSDYGDNEIEHFYDQLHNVNNQTTKKETFVVKGHWNAKEGKDACESWQGICEPFCNDDTNKRGLRLLEFATFDEHFRSSQSIQKMDLA